MEFVIGSIALFVSLLFVVLVVLVVHTTFRTKKIQDYVDGANHDVEDTTEEMEEVASPEIIFENLTKAQLVDIGTLNDIPLKMYMTKQQMIDKLTK